MQILSWGKQRKTLLDLRKNQEESNYKGFLGHTVLYVVTCEAIYLCILHTQAEQGGYQLLPQWSQQFMKIASFTL